MIAPAAGTFVRGWGRYKNSPGWIVTASGCHIWTGARGDNGYAIAVVGSVHTTAYRVRYEREVEPIPAGMELDHYVCNNGAGGCCNPLHCRPATPRENNLRSDSGAALNAAKTHCRFGHPLSGDNLVRSQLRHGRRLCRTCRNAFRRKAAA
jgi:hypothetical protein